MEITKYPIEIHRINEEDGTHYYFAFLPDFGYSACSATGNTIDEALDLLRKVEKDVIKHFRETGREIPRPSEEAKRDAAIKSSWEGGIKWDTPAEPITEKEFDRMIEVVGHDSDDMARWQQYLDRLPFLIGERHAHVVWMFWEDITSAMFNPPIPTAFPGGELGFSLALRTDNIYICVDLSETGERQWFYKNNVTGEELLRYEFEDVAELVSRIYEMQRAAMRSLELKQMTHG